MRKWDELLSWGCPLPPPTIGCNGPLKVFSVEEQKAKFLPDKSSARFFALTEICSESKPDK